MKYELTDEQRKNLNECYNLVKSRDPETVQLGVNLVFAEFENFKCPVRKYSLDDYIYTTFEYLRSPDKSDHLYYSFSHYKMYWLNQIEDLLNCGSYYDCCGFKH